MPVASFRQTPVESSILDKLGKVYNWAEKQYEKIPFRDRKQVQELLDMPNNPAGGIDDVLKLGGLVVNPRNFKKLVELSKKSKWFTDYSDSTLSPKIRELTAKLAVMEALFPKIHSLPSKINVVPENDTKNIGMIMQGIAAHYLPSNKEIDISPSSYGVLENIPNTISHELTHAAQFLKGKGKDPSPFKILVQKGDKLSKQEIPYPYAREKTKAIGKMPDLLFGMDDPVKREELRKKVDEFFFEAYKNHPFEISARKGGDTGYNKYKKFEDMLVEQAIKPKKEFTLTEITDLFKKVSPLLDRRQKKRFLAEINDLKVANRNWLKYQSKDPVAPIVDRGFHAIPVELQNKLWANRSKRYLGEDAETVPKPNFTFKTDDLPYGIIQPASRLFGVNPKIIDAYLEAGLVKGKRRYGGPFDLTSEIPIRDLLNQVK